nr:YcxB family protein [Lachnospiraceae bacterium]
ASPLAQAFMILMCLLIPAVQPLGVYLRAKSYALAIPQGMILETRYNGIYVEAGDKSDHIGWNKVSKVIDTGDCVVLKLAGGSGYFLFNRILGDKRKEFIEYVNRQIG